MYGWMDREREAEYSRHIRFTLLVKSKQIPLYQGVYKLASTESSRPTPA